MMAKEAIEREIRHLTQQARSIVHKQDGELSHSQTLAVDKLISEIHALKQHLADLERRQEQGPDPFGFSFDEDELEARRAYEKACHQHDQAETLNKMLFRHEYPDAQKIATFIPMTDELLADNARMRHLIERGFATPNEIRGRLMDPGA